MRSGSDKELINALKLKVPNKYLDWNQTSYMDLYRCDSIGAEQDKDDQVSKSRSNDL